MGAEHLEPSEKRPKIYRKKSLNFSKNVLELLVQLSMESEEMKKQVKTLRQ